MLTSGGPKAGRDGNHRKRGRRADLVAAFVLLAVPTIFLAEVLFGGKVLLPVDDLFVMPPWREFAAQFGISAPHNHLIADLIIQNYSWKTFVQESFAQGSLPLWNPYLLGGVPFLAAGQYGVLYPLGALFYLMPVATAYGWFTLLHLFLAGLFMYVFLRVIEVARIGALLGGLAFALSGFLVVSFVWPMILSTAIWLPLLLAMVELTIRGVPARAAIASGAPVGDGHGTGAPVLDPTMSKAPTPRSRWVWSPWLWPMIGAVVVALQFLAGHMEISFYVLFSAGFYAAIRLVMALWTTRRMWRVLAVGLALLGMVGLGGGMAAVQIVPFGEAISANFRAGFVTYDEVIGYALPKQRALSFLIPDFFGNPAVHSYWDVATRQIAPMKHQGDGGQDVDYAADWDRKNYVEGASYVGVLPLLLALLALLFRRNRYTWIFAAFAAWSLLLAFGAPIYRLFFYSIPGFDQLHTPFRWLFPYTLSVTALAGIGAGWLADANDRRSVMPLRRLTWIILAAGAAGALLLLGVLLWPQRLLPLAQRLLGESSRLHQAFGDGRAFLSFEWRNAAVFVLFVLLAGAVLLLSRRRGTNGLAKANWALLAVVVVVADLFVFGIDFNTRSDLAPLRFVPPSIQFLQNDPEPFRIVSFGEEDVLTPNTAMRFHLEDARGYDTIIPKQFVDYWSLIEDPHGYLIYSKIHKLRERRSLESPLLDLLNVKYVLTTQRLDLPSYTAVYQGEINVYRNEHYLPRAFVVGDAAGLRFVDSRAEVPAALGAPGFDPRRQLVLEDHSAPRSWKSEPSATVQSTITEYSPQRVVVSAQTAYDGYLVLADSYFPGWEATVDDVPTAIYRADGNFRAIYLPAGDHRVVFSYKPASFRAGIILSAVSSALLLLGAAFFLRPRGLFAAYGSATVQRVAKNSVMPMATSLLNKLISAAFAMVVLRLLGPDGVGKYTFAIVVSTYFEIFTNFGLNTLLTREVAKDPRAGNRYLSNTALLRLTLWLLSLPLVLGMLYFWHANFGLDRETALATLFLIAALVPGNLAAALSSLFYAYERMEYPAIVSIVSTLCTVGFGTIALLAGWSFIGLAAVAVVVNVLTAGVFVVLVARVFFRPRLTAERSLLGGMLGSAAPLMCNHLLATLFFRIDVLLLQPLRGNREVGYYGTAYRFVDALNVIPSAFTFAVFPLMSRYAESARDSLTRTYVLALKALVIVSLPITVGTVFLAEPIVLFFAGPAYLPEAAIALQVLIWFLPFSYVNSVTQYVLIAVNQQRFITAAFVGATVFNVVANLVLIPRYGLLGAAFVTILSEVVLLVPFLYAVGRHLGAPPLLALAGRPTVAAAVMAGFLWLFAGANPLLLIAGGAAVYGLSLMALRTFDRQDRLLLRQLLQRDDAISKAPSPAAQG